MKHAQQSILQVADYAPDYSGNFIASLKMAACEWRRRGFRSVWVFPAEVREYRWFRELLDSDSTSSAYHLSRTAGTLEHAWRIARIAAAENAVIVHAHFSRFDVAVWLASWICALRLRRFHVVWHAHSAFSAAPNAWRRLKDLVKLGFLGRTCHSVPVSEALRESLIARGFPARRVHVIQNGIDTGHATAATRTREEMRRALNIPEDACVLLGFGWTPIRKGVDTMLAALPILHARGMNPVLVLTGTRELQQFAGQWPDTSFRALLRIVPPAEHIGDLFRAADIFLSPSRAEGWCYAVAEAMVNGVPAVSSDIPPLAWAKGAPGVYFCPPANAAELAESVQRVWSLSPEARRATAAQAAQFVRSRHTVETWGQSIWALYRKLLQWEESPPRAPAPSPPPAEAPTRISVIVPCRNEVRHIRAFMDSLLAQELDPACELEILIADGMSDDGTRDVLRDYANRDRGLCVRVVDNPRRVTPAGLNAAIQASTGDIVVRMDVHTTYASDYIRECVRVLRETGVDSVGGPWVAQGSGVVGQAISAAFHSRFCNGGAKGHDPDYEGEVDTVYLGCWTRSAFEKAGLFDPELVRNQDDEFHFRLRRFGGRVWQSPRIRSTYSPRASIKALFRQYLQYGFWKVVVLRKHRGLAAWRHAVPGLFVASLIGGATLAGVAALLGMSSLAATSLILLAAELSLYAAACVAASFPLAGSLPWRVFLLLPVVIAVYHTSYGLGFLAGLGSWIARRRPEAASSQVFTALTR